MNEEVVLSFYQIKKSATTLPYKHSPQPLVKKPYLVHYYSSNEYMNIFNGISCTTKH